MVLEEKYREIIYKMTKIALVDVKAYFTEFKEISYNTAQEIVKNWKEI